MEVLRTKALSDKAAAKMLEKFVAAKQDEENADLMVRSVPTALAVRQRC